MAAILLIAAGGKTYALYVGEGQPYSSLPIPAWVVQQSVIVEWVLGVWLLAGVYPHAVWVCSIICFSLFFGVSMIAGLSGESVCGCFGLFATSPWLTALLDASILTALFAFRPSATAARPDKAAEFSTPHLLFRTGCLLLAISTASVVFAKGFLAQVNAGQDGGGPAPSHIAVSTDAASCSARCIGRAVSLARAELGLDPAWPDDKMPTDAKQVLAILRDAGNSVGGSVRVVTVADAISGLGSSSSAPVMLVSQSNHLYLLLGAIDVDGELMCQLLHGDSGVSLVAKSQLLETGFIEAWQFERGATKGVPLKIGQEGELLVDKVLHNFGEVRPDQQFECVFQLTNAGSAPIVLEKPRTSCGCTTTDLPKAITLQPRETRDFGVVIQPKDSPSMRESVLLTAFEPGNETPRQQELLLVGNQRQLMTVVPVGLDLGIVIPGKSYDRTVRLTEVPTDRFSIERIDSSLPIAHAVEAVKDVNGLTTYRVRLSPKVDGSLSGEQTGEVTIATSSRFRPRVVLPVKFKVAPPVFIEPSVVALGTIRVGEASSQKVRLVSRDNVPLAVTIASAPEGCSVEVNKQGRSTELIVTVTPATAGIWQGVIEAEVRNGSSEDLIEIRCAGVVREASPGM